MTTSDTWAHNLLRSKNQLRHKTGVTGPGELLKPVQHSPQLHSDQEPFLDRLEIANLQFPTRPRKPWGKPRDSNLRHL